MRSGEHEIALSFQAARGYKVLYATSRVSRSGGNPSLGKFEVAVGTDIRSEVIELLRERGLPVVE